jgi:hypothetical protein
MKKTEYRILPLWFSSTLILLLASVAFSQLINIPKSDDHKYLQRVVGFYGIESDLRSDNLREINSGNVNAIQANTLNVDNPEYEQKLAPLVKYSKDKRRYIDYASYSTIINVIDKHTDCSFDVDTEVSIGDAITGNKYRVAFIGSFERVEGAGWLSNESILIIKRNSEKKLIILEVINLKTMKYIEYEIQPKVNIESSYFYTELSNICQIDK